MSGHGEAASAEHFDIDVSVGLATVTSIAEARERRRRRMTGRELHDATDQEVEARAWGDRGGAA